MNQDQSNSEGPRTCGSCRLCCKLMAVYEQGTEPEPYRFIKHGARWCEHSTAAGCGLYHDALRPITCRTFRCLWLRGNLPLAHDPQSIQCVFSIQTQWLSTSPTGKGGDDVVLVVSENRPLASRDPRVRASISGVLASVPYVAGWMLQAFGERHPSLMTWRNGQQGLIVRDADSPIDPADGDDERRFLRIVHGGEVPAESAIDLVALAERAQESGRNRDELELAVREYALARGVDIDEIRALSEDQRALAKLKALV